MELALALADEAAGDGDVPVGAILVVAGEIVGRGRNRRQVDGDPFGHAEMMAISEGAKAVGSWRLPKSTLYVTLEPCPMCAGAILQSRIERVVFGCRDPKAGAVRSVFAMLEDPRLPHWAKVIEGILETQCRERLQTFFEGLRRREKSQ